MMANRLSVKSYIIVFATILPYFDPMVIQNEAKPHKIRQASILLCENLNLFSGDI